VAKARNGDEGVIALLKWALAALLFVNGAALALAIARKGMSEALLQGSGHYYAAGLLCALLGAGCWAISYRSAPAQTSEQPGSNDLAVAFGAVAIMLWVASLTTFVIGCQQVSWAPEHKGLHQPERPVLARERSD
jgi:hypothetical protein